MKHPYIQMVIHNFQLIFRRNLHLLWIFMVIHLSMKCGRFMHQFRTLIHTSKYIPRTNFTASVLLLFDFIGHQLNIIASVLVGMGY